MTNFTSKESHLKVIHVPTFPTMFRRAMALQQDFMIVFLLSITLDMFLSKSTAIFFLKRRKNDWMISQQSSQKMVGMHLPLGSHSKNPTKFQGFCQGFSSHLNVMSAWFVQRPLPSSPVYLFTESRRTNRSVHMLALHQKSFSLVKRLRPILMNPHFESHAYRIYYFTIICIC